MRKLLIALPAFALGIVLTASLTTVARAKSPAPAKVYDYVVATGPDDVRKYGKAGYQVIEITRSASGWPTWTMQRK